MAIAKMAKIVIVTHRTEAPKVLESLQDEGLCQILNAEQAMLTKDYPELCCQGKRPREVEELLGRLEKAVAFLEDYYEDDRSTVESMLAPRRVVGRSVYQQVISDKKLLKVLEDVENTQRYIEELRGRIDGLEDTLEMLEPWQGLETPVEELDQMEQAQCITGLLPKRSLDEITGKLEQMGAIVEQVGSTRSHTALLIVALSEKAGDIQKMLRTVDFDYTSFAGMKGKVSDLIGEYRENLEQAKQEIEDYYGKAREQSKEILKLQILRDHNANLLQRESTHGNVPISEETVFLEGWVKERNYSRLEKVIAGFSASSLSRIEPPEDEKPPVEVDNSSSAKPFEVITRLYGMPQHWEVDPTVLLAPFFIVFFALCLTDAAYGVIIAAVMAFALKRKQGDKKLVRLLCWSGVLTIAAGALTGGWFGAAVRDVAMGAGLTGIAGAIEAITIFDPMSQPMVFFVLAIILGYIQVMFGLVVALVVNLQKRDFVAAIFDQVSWLVMLNGLAIYAMASAETIFPKAMAGIVIWFVLVSAAAILFFSHREGGIGARIGMGAYNLFSTVFYLGDILSYLRVMALGLATAGVAMAVNVIAETSLGMPYIGIILAILLFVGGHAFNIAMSGLGAFVHTMRLQFVEFFPKFLVGGGEEFKPLSREYKHIYVMQDKTEQQ